MTSKFEGLPKIIERLQDGSYTPHNQIIFFTNGSKRTIMRVKWIWENEMIHLVTENGIEFVINKDKVLFTQRRLEFKNDTF
jgi:hypothetical protein